MPTHPALRLQARSSVILLSGMLMLIPFACLAQGSAPASPAPAPPAPASPPPLPFRVLAPQFSGAQTIFAAENFINPLTYNNSPYPELQPWLFRNTVTRRFSFNDVINGATIQVGYQHGGSNFMKEDTLLRPKTIYGNFENINALELDLTSNTDVQDGGTLTVGTTHYGHGDSVMFTATTNATGGSRGADEGNRVFRVFSQFHGDNYGILIATLRTDAFGQAILTAPKGPNGVPIPSPGHEVRASMENGPLLNTNPLKIYQAGDAADVERCPDPLPNGTAGTKKYMCITGDAATQWSQHFGLSGVTTLLADLSDENRGRDKASADRFAAGPVCADIALADTSFFKPGQLFTISSGGDNFEQPAVLSVGKGTIRACFAKPHAAGEVVSTGGAVGHALSFPNDDMLPHTVPGVDNTNNSTLRLGYPIVASLPGNVLMVWVDPAGSGGEPELKSRGFASNTPRQQAVFTPVLDPATHGIASWTIATGGDYITRGNTHEGADILPPPAISFAGSVCRELPVAHAVYAGRDFGLTPVKPVTDKPGNCTSLKVAIQQTYPNPVRIYPMLWARSNRDPDFVGSSALNEYGFNASTTGYMVAGGTSPEFSVGDPVEFGYWWQQYISSQIMMSRWMGKSHSFGSYFNLDFNGMYGQALMHLANLTDPADYYGTPETGFNPGLHGEGRMAPPIAYQVYGPVQYGLVMQLPTPRAGTSEDAGGLHFECGNGPCSHGHWNQYDWINAQGKDNDFAGLRFDPDAHSLTFFDFRNGLFLSPNGIGTSSLRSTTPGRPISIDETTRDDAKGTLRAGTLQLTGHPDLPCDADHRFQQNPIPGAPGTADTYQVCLKDAQDHYAWHTLALTQ